MEHRLDRLMGRNQGLVQYSSQLSQAKPAQLQDGAMILQVFLLSLDVPGPGHARSFWDCFVCFSHVFVVYSVASVYVLSTSLLPSPSHQRVDPGERRQATEETAAGGASADLVSVDAWIGWRECEVFSAGTSGVAFSEYIPKACGMVHIVIYGRIWQSSGNPRRG